MSQQNLKNNKNNQDIYKNSFDCIQRTVRNEGILALYKGFLPSYLRIGPWSMIVWFYCFVIQSVLKLILI